jgi:hypothetical protein
MQMQAILQFLVLAITEIASDASVRQPVCRVLDPRGLDSDDTPGRNLIQIEIRVLSEIYWPNVDQHRE